MLRALLPHLLPLLLASSICLAAPPPAEGVATQPVPTSNPTAVPASAPAPGKSASSASSASSAAPAKPPSQPAKPAPVDDGRKSDGYRALVTLLIMGMIALRHARNGSP